MHNFQDRLNEEIELEARLHRMSKADLYKRLDETSNDAIVDMIYDELERRERDMDLRDWTEQDRMAAASELYEIWRNEY